MDVTHLNFSTVSTNCSGGLTADGLSVYKSKTLQSPRAGWSEIQPYSAWDLGNKYACSQSTLVARQSHDKKDTSAAIPSVMPTLFSMQSSIAESDARVSFSQCRSSEQQLPTASIASDFGMSLGSRMGKAHRMQTLMNNPSLIEQYHKAAKLTDNPEVQFEFAKQLLLCGSADLASDSALLNSSTPESKLVREGVFWILRLASKRHHSESCFLVGRWYELGKYGCKLNFRKSAKYFSIAAKSQHPAALYHLACIYELTQKPKRARECFEAASKRGFSLASYRLGMAYLSGAMGVVADFSLACSFLREALFHATHPVSDAGYHLAVALIQLPSFDPRAVSEPHLYLKRAWSLGHSDAGALLNDILR
ncbi:hypothetical protein J3B02_002665 [Coemansia erecta]|uniref:Uncharacterized protein n=1 Tax=Coemansia asiatica TaxID=1052880 RepID=A0A9W8CLA0_9FUNG|nr:hypothetical protein LPJ64_000052 [Coemansia asiatica]KAJ2854453.1 hypothetical protein J3B02_002665 [Coemansia erecta]KAJ2879629.1 hypothetical protein FB639_003040 [Coemansia asiatica]